jgi:hypothetical protein
MIGIRKLGIVIPAAAIAALHWPSAPLMRKPPKL